MKTKLLWAKRTMSFPYAIHFKGMVSMADYIYGLNDNLSRIDFAIEHYLNPESVEKARKHLKTAKKYSNKVKSKQETIKFWSSYLPEHEIERDITLIGGYRYRQFTFKKRYKYELINLMKGQKTCSFSIITEGLTLNFVINTNDFRNLFGVSNKRNSIHRRKNWILKKKVERRYKGSYKVYTDAGYGDGSTIDYGLSMIEALKVYHRHSYSERPFDLSDYVSKNSYTNQVYVTVYRDDGYLNLCDDSRELVWEREDFDPGDI